MENQGMLPLSRLKEEHEEARGGGRNDTLPPAKADRRAGPDQIGGGEKFPHRRPHRSAGTARAVFYGGFHRFNFHPLQPR